MKVGEAYNTSLWIYPTSALQGSGFLFKFESLLKKESYDATRI